MKTSITSGQKKQYLRFVEDAAERALAEAGPDKDGLQQLISKGGEFQTDIVASIKKLSVSSKFADEEVKSSYAYPSGYKLKGLTEQINILRQLFPGVGYSDPDLREKAVTGKLALPENAEGWFAIPRWEKFAPTYGEAVQVVLAKLGSTRPFHNYCEGQLGPDWLRQREKTVKMFQMLGNQQKGDILIAPAQFGLLHRGRSARRAREVFKTNEFGLGSFAIACMLLTHKERLVQWEQLHIDCAGDEYALDADGQFSRAPCFYWRGGELRFHAPWYAYASARCGSASGFFPQ